MTDAGPRCPAILSPLTGETYRCGLVHHPEHEKHQAGGKHWEAPLSEAERVKLLAEMQPMQQARESLKRRTILRAEVEEACLRAAKTCASLAEGASDPMWRAADAASAKAYVEAACLLRGT